MMTHGSRVRPGTPFDLSDQAIRGGLLCLPWLQPYTQEQAGHPGGLQAFRLQPGLTQANPGPIDPRQRAACNARA